MLSNWALSYWCWYTSESNKTGKREGPANCRWRKKNFNKLINAFLYCTCLQGFIWSWNRVEFTKWTDAKAAKEKLHYHKSAMPPGAFIRRMLNIPMLYSVLIHIHALGLSSVWTQMLWKCARVPEDTMTALALSDSRVWRSWSDGSVELLCKGHLKTYQSKYCSTIDLFCVCKRDGC